MTEQIMTRSKNKATIGLVLIVFSVLLFMLSVIPNFALTKFCLGVFGLAWYGDVAVMFLLGIALSMKLKYAFTARFTLHLFVAVLSIVTLLHVIFSTATLAEYQGFEYFREYMSVCYNGTNGITVGGVISGVFSFIFRNIFGMVGLYSILVMLSAIFVGVVIDSAIYGKAKKQTMVEENKEVQYEEMPSGKSDMIDTSLSKEEQEDNELEPIVFEKPEQTSSSKSIFSGVQEEKYISPAAPKSPRESARATLFGPRDVPNITMKDDQERDEFMRNYRRDHSDEIVNEEDDKQEDDSDISNLFGSSREPSEKYRQNFPPQRPVFENSDDEDEEEEERFSGREPRRISRSERAIINIDDEIDDDEPSILDNSSPLDLNRSEEPIRGSEPQRTIPQQQRPEPQRVQPQPQQRQSQQMGMRSVRYNAIPISMFKEYVETTEDHSEEYRRKSAALEQVMNEFGIAAKVINVVRGPKVTRYEMSLPAGVSTTKVTAIQNNISMALEARSMIRIEAPIPGKNAIGIELENDKSTTVGMRELLESKEFVNFKDPLPIAIGKDINGSVIIKSLPKLVHALVAGSTGSGKSVFIHSVVMSVLYKYSPDQVRFIMVDPKRVEFTLYNNLPHLLFPNVLVEHDKALNALKWAVAEMMRRYDAMNQNECRNLEGYNNLPDVKNGKLEKMPYIIIVVDELAELMCGALKKDFESNIQRIAQLGRAAGIHMVVATQRPSVDVVPGTIKNNFPTRVAFALSSSADSKTILDEGGAESLLGKGDMLFAPQDSNRKIRLQAAFCTDEEIMNAVKYVKANNAATYNEDIMKEVYAEKEEEVPVEEGANSPAGRNNGMDEYMKLAVDYARASGTVSSSVLQRKFHIGYNRAASIVDQMIEFGWVGPPNGSKPREFRITDEQYRELFGEEDDGLL